MRQVTVAGDTPVPIDQYLTPINVAYVASGGTVQVSYTDPFPLDAQGYPDPAGPTFVWIAAPANPIVNDPIRAIQTTGSGNTLTVIQAGVR